MKCILVFDALNDIIFSKYDKEFSNHLNAFAKAQKLIPDQHVNDTEISSNVIVQIFSPLITSHRIMNCEFGNTYSSIECADGTNLVFDEYMGFLFVAIGKEQILSLKAFQSKCIAVVRAVCSVNVLLLKTDSSIRSLVCGLIDSWIRLSDIDQAIKVEAIEQLVMNNDLSAAAIQALKEAVNKIKLPKVHALLMVENKFLSLYSSQDAKELSAADILFLMVLNNLDQHGFHFNVSEATSDFESLSTIQSDDLQDSSQGSYFVTNIESYYLYLCGYKAEPKCVPHAIHTVHVTHDIWLLIVIESSFVSHTCIRVYEALSYVNVLQNLHIQRNLETTKQTLQNLEIVITKLTDNKRYLKIQTVDVNHKLITTKWKQTKRLYQEFMRVGGEELLSKAECSLNALSDSLNRLFESFSCDYNFLNVGKNFAKDAAIVVATKLVAFNDMFKVKAIKNFSLGSYLEQFPGLIHFIYIDRTTHRVIAPTLDINSEDDTNMDFREEIWQMIEFSQKHLQEGYLSLIWKDSTFTKVHFLWFEDSSGMAIKPTNQYLKSSTNLAQPGIMNGDFYHKLKQMCFPKLSPDKVRCYELYSIHLKIVAPALALDHMRQLMATVWEIKGHPGHPIDLL